MTKQKRKSGRSRADDRRRELPYAEEGQLYARVIRMLGNGRLAARCGDGKERICKICGSMRKREWVNPGDTVLVSLREFDDEKADVIYRYKPPELQHLARNGEPVCIAADEEEAELDDLVSFAPELAAEDGEVTLNWETI
jgi:translation initiation factor 1A